VWCDSKNIQFTVFSFFLTSHSDFILNPQNALSRNTLMPATIKYGFIRLYKVPYAIHGVCSYHNVIPQRHLHTGSRRQPIRHSLETCYRVEPASCPFNTFQAESESREETEEPCADVRLDAPARCAAPPTARRRPHSERTAAAFPGGAYKSATGTPPTTLGLPASLPQGQL